VETAQDQGTALTVVLPACEKSQSLYRHAGRRYRRGHREESRCCTHECVRHGCSGGLITFGGPEGHDDSLCNVLEGNSK